MPDIFIAPKPKKEIETASFKPETPVVKKVSRVNPLAAFAVSPLGVHFEDQEEEEKIIFLLRRHWITNVPWLFTGTILALTPLVFAPFFLRLGILPPIPGGFALVGTLFWYLLSTGYLFLNFLIWYFNVYLVTTERVVDVDFYNLLYHQVSSTRIAKIQDVTYKRGGLLHAIFDYGDIFIQTAGTEVNFDFLAVPKPTLVTQKIGELMEKEERQWEEK